MKVTRCACALCAGVRLLLRMTLIGRFVTTTRSVDALQYGIEKYIERSHSGVGGL